VYLAVQKHGVSNWSAVVTEGSLRHRTNVQVKDKWRTMEHQGRLTELRAKFGPVGHPYASRANDNNNDDDGDASDVE